MSVEERIVGDTTTFEHRVLGSDHHVRKIDNASIDYLKASFALNGGKVLTQNDFQYESYTTPWNSLCPERPYVVFVPSTYNDIQDAFNLIRDSNEIFNVMSGGHNWDCEALTSGALINTSLLNKIDLDTDNQTITVGAGVVWDDIYHLLKDSGYVAIGPLCPTVGVSGFTLGGGFNWFLSTFYGTAAENTISIDVLLADGNIVTATRDNEYSDLAWGLLGSGRGQMGIVLQFTMRIHVEQGYTHLFVPYYFTSVESEVDMDNGIYPLDHYLPIYKTWVQAVKVIMDDEDIGSIAMNTNRDFTDGTTTQKYLFFVAGVFNGVNDWNNKQSMMKVIDQFQPNGFYQTHFDQWYDMDYTLFAPPWMKYPITSWAGPLAFLTEFDEDVVERHGRAMVPLSQDDADTFATGTHLESFLIKGAVQDTSLTSVGNANAVWKLARFFLETPLDAMEEIFENVHQWNKDIAKMAGNNYLGGYINYGDSTLDAKFYYGENLNRLQEIKEKYDQHNVFVTKQGVASIPPRKGKKGKKGKKGSLKQSKMSKSNKKSSK